MKPSSLRRLAVLVLLTAGYCTTPPPTGLQPAPLASATLTSQPASTVPTASPTSPAPAASSSSVKQPLVPTPTGTPGASPSPTPQPAAAIEKSSADTAGGPTQPLPAEAGPGSTPVPAEISAPTPTPESAGSASTAEASSAPAGGEACVDKVAFVEDVTIPDNTLIRQGESFTKTWRLRNVGTCAWTGGYQLIFASGDPLNGPLSGPGLPPAEPGKYIDISIDLTAPMNGGSYTGNWEFQNPAGTRFGVGMNARDPIWAAIQVNWLGPEASGSGSGGDSGLADTGGAGAPDASACQAVDNPGYLNQVLELVNQARAVIGLLPLTLQPQLSAAAQAHSLDMACNNFVDHVGSDGSKWGDRIAQQGYLFKTAWENIYVGNPSFGGTPQGAMAWWMNSQVHRENILNPNAFEVGVGYAFNPNSTYGGYYTLVFASPAGEP